MHTFNIVAKREVTLIERANFLVEANSQEEAQTLADKHLNEEPTMGNLVWSETDATEAAIGDAKVESVKLHSFDEETAAAE